ncbi:SRPBCC family protein [Streptomyces sp. 3MP-14]|uniref:SRPBCC family protein n=1 Tax=Streptomyces mimosae TaxID=2586635 RepID=A0A5N6AJI9_9ACTN|nr:MULTISPECIES: SRPBCC family protein [Streptomyces]KAB8167728.1 SRPBCC family protein [Streptomyces mimosae]KAB8177625.1 SRPBCC family protein [Streptomyces sp. 3MP-14]
MAQVEVEARRVIAARPEEVYAALADYREVHPRLLPEEFTDYEVREGGQGAGTVIFLRLHATRKRVRECVLEISEPEERTLVETDRDSTLVTTWTITPDGGDDRCVARVRTVWEGSGGIGGFFERLFAPRVLKGVYERLLENLAAEAERGSPTAG